MATLETRMRFRVVGFILPLLLLAGGRVWAAAEAEGTIINTEDKPFKGLVSYKSLSKVYIVKTTGAGGAVLELEVPLATVKSLAVAEPPALRPAVQQVREGKFQAAIPVLDNLAQDYILLQWDVPATRWLVEAYLRDGKPDKAVRACDRVIDKRPEAALSGELGPIYWQALLAAGQNNKLDDQLTAAAKSPSPEAQARANIMRGEVLRKQSKSKDALRDGYLRTVVLFKWSRDPGVRDARAEALFKAAECFDDLGTIQAASNLRKICMTEHAESEWARRLKAGER